MSEASAAERDAFIEYVAEAYNVPREALTSHPVPERYRPVLLDILTDMMRKDLQKAEKEFFAGLEERFDTYDEKEILF